MLDVANIRTQIKIVTNPPILDKRVALILMVAGGASLFFLFVKAITTGFWLDEAWISRVLCSNLNGKGWQDVFQHGERFQNYYFPSGVSTGPTLLIPGVIITLLFGKVLPPALHLLVLAHSILIWLALRILKIENKIVVLSIFLVLAALSREVNITHFLGEYPGACWFVLGLSFVARTMDKSVLRSRDFVWPGLFFGFSVLSKQVFLISLVPLCALLLLSKYRQWRSLLPMVFAITLPVLLWHMYQLFHVGSWHAYVGVLMDYLTKIADNSSGSGVFFNKSGAAITGDIVKLSTGGPAYFAAGCFILSGGIISKRLSPPVISKWILYSWISASTGMFWWVFISRTFEGQAAVYRHAAGFVVIALVPISCLVVNLTQRLTASSFVDRRVKSLMMFSFLILSIATVGVTGYRSWVYAFKRKGYGPYSSWSHQRQLAEWIRLYGTADTLLPVINCDSSFANPSFFDSHVEFPQRILSSGLYHITPCSEAGGVAKTGGPLVFFDGQSAVSALNFPYTLKEGDANGQGLWVAKNT